MTTTLSAIKRIEIAASKLNGVISLAQGVPSCHTHPIIRQKVINAINSNQVDKYSLVAGLPELRQTISQHLKQQQMSYNPETEIIVTIGSIEGLFATFLSLLKTDDEVIIPTPTYPYYKRMTNFTKSKPIEIQFNEQKNWSLNMEQIKKAITPKTKAFIICNPNNPTGTVYTKEQLIAIGQLAQQHNFYIIIDSVYDHFYFGENQLFNLCTETQFKPNIIRIVSLSKHFCMTGWRSGFIHGPKKLVQKILPTHDTMVNCAPVVTQYASIAALKNQQKIVPPHLHNYQKQRQIMGKTLEMLSKHLTFVWPQGAYYFFPKLRQIKNSEQFCFELLQSAKLATVPGSEFGPAGESHFRLCFGRSEKNIIEGMSRLKKYFQSQ